MSLSSPQTPPKNRRHMHNRLRAIVASLALFLVFTRPVTADHTAESESRLREAVTYLASDALEGRGVGTAGLDKAADYIASQFSQLSLRTNLFSGTPFQEFEIPLASELGTADQNRLAFVGPGNGKANKQLKLGEAFTPLALGGSGSFDAPLVFAGYGITAKDLKRGDQPFAYDDYSGIDAKGKVIVLLRKEPQQKDKNSPFNGTQTTQHATFARKLQNADEHGAAGVIFVNDELELASRREESTKLL